MRPRLYVDEDVVLELARMLRFVGEGAISAHEVGAHGLSDEEQLARASAENRAIFTTNYGDFTRIAVQWFDDGRAHAGIILSYRQYSRPELGELRRAILALLDGISAEHLQNSVQVLGSFPPH